MLYFIISLTSHRPDLDFRCERVNVIVIDRATECVLCAIGCRFCSLIARCPRRHCQKTAELIGRLGEFTSMWLVLVCDGSRPLIDRWDERARRSADDAHQVSNRHLRVLSHCRRFTFLWRAHQNDTPIMGDLRLKWNQISKSTHVARNCVWTALAWALWAAAIEWLQSACACVRVEFHRV